MSPDRSPNRPGHRLNEANIQSSPWAHRAGLHRMEFDLEVWDLKHLNRLMSQMKEKAGVSAARRVSR